MAKSLDDHVTDGVRAELGRLNLEVIVLRAQLSAQIVPPPVAPIPAPPPEGDV